MTGDLPAGPFRPAVTLCVLPALVIASIVPGVGLLPSCTRPPLLRSGVIATWCIVFVAVIRELSAAVILFTSETKVVSVLIFDLKEGGDVGAIAVLSLAMIPIITVVIAIADRVGGSWRGAAT